MKKLLYTIFVILILTTAVNAFDLLRFGFIGPSSSVSVPSVGDAILWDASGDAILWDASGDEIIWE